MFVSLGFRPYREGVWQYCHQAIREEFAMAPVDLRDAIKAARQEGVELIKDRLVDVAEEKLEHALDQLAAHVDESTEALVLVNEKAIGLVVDDAKAKAIKAIDGLVAASEESQEPMEEETLVEKFGEDIDAVLEDFAKAIAGLDDAEAVQHGRNEAVSKADATRKITSRHNHRQSSSRMCGSAKWRETRCGRPSCCKRRKPRRGRRHGRRKPRHGPMKPRSGQPIRITAIAENGSILRANMPLRSASPRFIMMGGSASSLRGPRTGTAAWPMGMAPPLIAMGGGMARMADSWRGVS